MVSAQAFEPSVQLTFDTAEADRKRLLKYVQSSNVSGLKLDLSHVTQCDSAGIALLIEAKRLCKQYSKPFEIEGMPNVIHELAEFCGLDAILFKPHVSNE